MRGLGRDAILAAQDLDRVCVAVPEWGGDVWVRTMTGAERDQWELSILNGGRHDLSNARAKLAVMVVCDADGKRLFDSADVAALALKSGAALTRIYAAAARLNAITEDDVGELVKNSERGPRADSGTSSPGPSAARSARPSDASTPETSASTWRNIV